MPWFGRSLTLPELRPTCAGLLTLPYLSGPCENPNKLTFVFVNVLAPAIRARALTVSRSAQSIRSGGWRPALDRYPHENIHGTRPDRASAGHPQIAGPFRGRGAGRPDLPGRCSRAGAKVPGKPAGASALFPNQPGIRP